MDDETQPADVIRNAREIARRSITLSQLVSVAFGAPSKEALAWLTREGLADEISPREQSFLSAPEPTQEEVVALTWRVECLAPLLWSIGKIDRMPELTEECDTNLIRSALVWPPDSIQSFVDSAVLRNEAEIQAEYQRVYDAHWRVRDARLFGRPAPDGLDEEVIFERHYGFNWVIGYGAQDWDEISTDT